MEEVQKFIHKWFREITVSLLFLIFVLNLGGYDSSLEKLDQNDKQINQQVNQLNEELSEIKSSQITKDEVFDVQMDIMFQYLIYERDLDNKDISLSEIKQEIKNKKKENDQ